MSKFFSGIFLFFICTTAFKGLNDPALKTINEKPSVGYVRTYNVLESNADTLFGEFSETYNDVEITHGYYRNNKPDGKWEFDNADGKKERIMSFDNGELNGVYLRFSKSGDTLAYSFYKNGNPDGVSKAFYNSGQPSSVQFYNDGKED